MLYSSLIGLSFICNAAGFAPVPVSTARRSGGSQTLVSSHQTLGRRHGTAWRAVVEQQAVVARVRALMTADGAEGEAEAAAPRLKRVRKRRKDASSVATAEDEETAEASPSSAVDTSPPAPVETVESARGPAAVVAKEDVDVLPQVVAPQQVAAAAAADVPRSAGVTKGTKVSVDNSDDDITEKMSDVASAASGAAGEAASAVTDAAKSAFGAAMSVLGQGGEPSMDDFDIDNMPSPGGSRTTPGKSSSELSDLGEDIERFRSLENKQAVGTGESLAMGAKDLVSKIIAVDFFVVIAFMLWFIAGVVSSYGFNNTFLLNEFNDKWTPIVQPALGVLMGGTIAGGVVSKLGGSGDEDETER